MGDRGSGAQRTRLGLSECRALEIGELCDGGRWQCQLQGTVLWRERRGNAELARLSYVIIPAKSSATGFAFAYRYLRAGEGEPPLHAFELDCSAGARPYAICPTCDRRVRILYAPLYAELFACRVCCHLVYRRSPPARQQATVVEVAGPARIELAALPVHSRRRARRRYVAAPPAHLARELERQPPEGEAASQLWCLRLRAAGLSYRQIAAELGLSKSSAARICRAGPEAIDPQALVRERIAEAYRSLALPADETVGGLAAYLRASHRQALRLGLYEHPLSEREERLVLFAGEDAGSQGQ